MSYFSEEIEIGIGELIFYCFIPTHAEAFYGMELLVATLIMAGIGLILNLWFLEKSGFIESLPAPILFELSPLVFMFLF